MGVSYLMGDVGCETFVVPSNDCVKKPSNPAASKSDGTTEEEDKVVPESKCAGSSVTLGDF